MDPLTFAGFRQANMTIRGRGKKFPELAVWSPMEWGCALAGEIGECLNLVKKLQRRRPTDPPPEELLPMIADELGDSFIYLDLLASRLGIDLGAAVRRKMKKVVAKRGVEIDL